MECIAIIVLLIMLSIIGWIIDLIVPGKMPFGWLGGVIAAIIGGIIGGFLFGFLDFGPWVQVNNIRFYFIPAALGGIVLAFIIRFIMGATAGNRRTL